MNEREVVDALIREIQFAAKSYWQQPGYKESIFRIFCESPKLPNGIPSMWGG